MSVAPVDDGGGGAAPATPDGGGGGVPDEVAGSGGGSDEPSQVVALRTPTDQVACHGTSVYWLSDARRVVRLRGAVETEVLDVSGSGEILLRSAEGGALVSLLGDDGAVWLVSDDSEPVASLVHRGRVVTAAFGDGAAWWYDGDAIRSVDTVGAAPNKSATSVSAHGGHVYWIDESGELFGQPTGAEEPVIQASDVQSYAHTLHAFGSYVAWGSVKGMRVLTAAGDEPLVFGADARALARADDGVVFCNQARPDAAWVNMVSNELRRSGFASNTSCLAVARCGDRTYWSTVDGRIMMSKKKP